jgi:hypothetical protein
MKLKPFLSSNGAHNNEDRIFNKKELANYLGVDVSWLDKKVSIDRWIEKQTIKPISGFKL